MITWLENSSNFTLGPTSADGETVSESLGHCDNIGDDVGMLETKPLPRSRKSSLYFINHHQHATLVTQLANALQIFT